MAARCLTERVSLAQSRSTRLLVLYLTVGDPVLGDLAALAEVAVEAGADALELGIPTPTVRPRGADIAASFERAAAATPFQAWAALRRIRAAVPGTPLLALAYPSTVADLGQDRLLDAAQVSGVDGLVLTDPRPAAMAEVVASGIAAIPVLTTTDPATRVQAAEAAADVLTYRTLAGRTGGRLSQQARATVRGLAATATEPFLVGFGIKTEAQLREVTRESLGAVVGSQFLRLLTQTEPERRLGRARSQIARWRAALDAVDAPRDDAPTDEVVHSSGRYGT